MEDKADLRYCMFSLSACRPLVGLASWKTLQNANRASEPSLAKGKGSDEGQASVVLSEEFLDISRYQSWVVVIYLSL